MQQAKQITEYRRQLRQRILEYSLKEFATNGIKAVKMDDIADGLQISKRTLYEIYSNKEELLFEGLKTYHNEYEQKIHAYAINHEANVMEIVVFALNYHMTELSTTSPEFISDMKKYPAISAYFKEQHEQQRDNFKQFLRRGVDEGYFRNDINFDLMECIINGIQQMLHSMDLYKKISMKDVFYTFMQVIFRAICTEKGMAEFEKFKLS